MQDFEYAAASTVDEAVSLLAARGERAKILAGGTDILVQLREDLREADLLVDVKKIPELMEIRWDPGLILGAAVPCYKIYGDPKIRQSYGGVCDAARIIGGWQIQSRASLGGNLCNSSPAADSIPAMIAYGAEVKIAGPQGVRMVKVEEFCTSPGRNVLERGEFVVSILFPPPLENSGGHYLRFIPRNEMDIAVCGAGAWLQLDGDKIKQARIALGAVAPKPVVPQEACDFLAGKPATEETFREAAELAKKVATPITDMRGPLEYRIHLAGVLTHRALKRSAERARGGVETNGSHL